MLPIIGSILWLAGLICTATPAQPQAGFVYYKMFASDGIVCLETRPYTPHEGDIVIFTYNNSVWRIFYNLADSGPPYHTGIVIREPSGRLSSLEVASTDDWKVYILPLAERLPAYEGRVWIRRLKTPLTATESAQLTDFATDQTEKDYAFGRVLLSATLRPCGALGRRLLGETSLQRDDWFCSELVVAACVAAGKLDPKEVAAHGIYPRDLFTDKPFDLSATWERPMLWSARAASATMQELIEKYEVGKEEQEVLERE
jgi:hypothetical protein